MSLNNSKHMTTTTTFDCEQLNALLEEEKDIVKELMQNKVTPLFKKHSMLKPKLLDQIFTCHDQIEDRMGMFLRGEEPRLMKTVLHRLTKHGLDDSEIEKVFFETGKVHIHLDKIKYLEDRLERMKKKYRMF